MPNVIRVIRSFLSLGSLRHERPLLVFLQCPCHSQQRAPMHNILRAWPSCRIIEVRRMPGGMTS
jgi:hypothetical protein